MAKEIIINTHKEQTRIAITEKGDLVELYIESPENERTIGDIYLGRIRRVMPNIQAAFVDIGQKQDAFLHFSDLADNLPDWLDFLKASKPEVGKVELHQDHQRPAAKRRRPRGGRKHVVKEPEPDEGEEARPNSRKDAQARGKRRSVQRRATRKQDAPPEKSSQGRNRGRGRQKSQPSRDRSFRPENLLKRDQRIVVKISKEPISAKGSRVTTDLSLAGRFLVLVPLADYIAVSKKIVSYKERRRLRALARSLVPDGYGVIVRTVAEGKNAKALDTDLRLLIDKWRKIQKKLAEDKDTPRVLHEDVNMASSVVRDLFSDDYDRILIDSPRVYRNIKNYVQAVAPHMGPAVKLYKGQKSVFQQAGIEKSINEAFESRVDLPSGGYLFIEHTEAMHVIDVNSGRAGKGLTQEQNSLRVNMEAARIIAKQLRLRDLGGIIVVDFIDLRDDKNRKKVYDELKRAFRRDRAVTKVLPMSDFGLIQITRQRLRPSITTTMENISNGTSDSDEEAAAPPQAQVEPEPVPETALESAPPEPAQKAPPMPENRVLKLRPPRISVDDLTRFIEEGIANFKSQDNGRKLILRVHPFTAAYLNRKLPNQPARWFMKHLIRIRVEIDEKLSPMTYRFVDPGTEKDITRSLRKEDKRHGRRSKKSGGRQERSGGPPDQSGGHQERSEPVQATS